MQPIKKGLRCQESESQIQKKKNYVMIAGK